MLVTSQMWKTENLTSGGYPLHKVLCIWCDVCMIDGIWLQLRVEEVLIRPSASCFCCDWVWKVHQSLSLSLSLLSSWETSMGILNKMVEIGDCVVGMLKYIRAKSRTVIAHLKAKSRTVIAHLKENNIMIKYLSISGDHDQDLQICSWQVKVQTCPFIWLSFDHYKRQETLNIYVWKWGDLDWICFHLVRIWSHLIILGVASLEE